MAPDDITRVGPPAPLTISISSKNSSPSSPIMSCPDAVSFFTTPSSSLTRPSSPMHLSAVRRLLSVLASAHSCNATTLASSPSTYSRSDLALCMTSIPSAARLFASTADCVTRLISSCISATMASFSRRLRSACSVSILDMRSSSWRLVSVFLLDCCSFISDRWVCSRLLYRPWKEVLRDSRCAMRDLASLSSVRRSESLAIPLTRREEGAATDDTCSS
mmetsp:Transcript_36944/g.78021  ORF Transcript_36944/g.78021 Transcript_36944/m.78021 type:complete len:219 (+) Transcript_36944:676-1332(+)